MKTLKQLEDEVFKETIHGIEGTIKDGLRSDHKRVTAYCSNALMNAVEDFLEEAEYNFKRHEESRFNKGMGFFVIEIK